MELTSTPIPTRTTPETESETSPPTQPIKPTDHHHNPRPLSFTNGVLKRHKNHHHPPPPSATPVVVCYKECLRNHAASLGGHALDGCGEFMPSPTAIPTDPTSLKCAACGCHRNFHRRDPEEGTHIVEFHHPPPLPPPPPRSRSPNSASPPPLSSSYYPSAPHMLLALSTGVSGGGAARDDNPAVNANATTTTTRMMMSGGNPDGRKRHRTKFSQEQKEKMYLFAERVGWKMQKRDEVVVEEFCNEVGIGKGVLKVWMHNNKNTFAKRDVNTSRNSLDTNNNHHHHNDHHDNNSSAHVDVATNGSSSSS